MHGMPAWGITPGPGESYNGYLSRGGQMIFFRLVAFTIAILTLAGCSPAPTDPVNAASDTTSAARSQRPVVVSPVPNAPEREGGDGGGGY
jgi:hypothetical protein